ncbi:uncharacterized protein [Magallana gigas]|uniref:uncharacterized protein n=1 Tax=Magallana gigas TaxID=29159 RepID=UPI00333EA158
MQEGIMPIMQAGKQVGGHSLLDAEWLTGKQVALINIEKIKESSFNEDMDIFTATEEPSFNEDGGFLTTAMESSFTEDAEILTGTQESSFNRDEEILTDTQESR